MGYRHPDHLLAGMTASQLQELEWFYGFEPFGEYRDELRHGAAMALTANINRDDKLKPDPFDTADFMHYVESPVERKLTDKEIEEHFEKIFGC